jgi:hypothetical protein
MKTLFQLVNRIPNAEPDKDTIKFQVGKFKEAIASILKKLDAPAKKEGSQNQTADVREIENSSAKLFEEIKIMFQDLPSRIERANPTEGRKRRRRIHPGMIEEMIHMSKDGKLGIRIALSFYKEKMPWVYDEGIILLNKLEGSKTPTTLSRYMREFEELLMFSIRNPMVEELLMDDQEEYYLFMELPRLILRNIERIAYGKL